MPYVYFSSGVNRSVHESQSKVDADAVALRPAGGRAAIRDLWQNSRQRERGIVENGEPVD